MKIRNLALASCSFFLLAGAASAQSYSCSSSVSASSALIPPLVPSPPGLPLGGHVEPGLVRWHADFASACAAARRSGRPVLLFQLLGRLDDELC